jgi:hypothetical protein
VKNDDFRAIAMKNDDLLNYQEKAIENSALKLGDRVGALPVYPACEGTR